jgi:hypothetical protein
MDATVPAMSWQLRHFAVLLSITVRAGLRPHSGKDIAKMNEVLELAFYSELDTGVNATNQTQPKQTGFFWMLRKNRQNIVASVDVKQCAKGPKISHALGIELPGKHSIEEL